MKILFGPAHYAILDDRGSELEWAYEISHNLAKKHKNSVVITGFTNLINPPYRVVQLQQHYKIIDMGIFNTVRFALLYGFEAYRRLKSENFDIHHHVLPFAIARTFNPAFFLYKSKEIVRIIGPIQNSLPFYPDNLHDPHQIITPTKILLEKILVSFVSFLQIFISWLSKRTLLRADAVIAVNSEVKKSLIRYGLSKERVHVIPAGVNTKTFEKLTHGARLVDKKKVLRLISVGTLMERKAFDKLILAVSVALKKSPYMKIELIILGDGPQREKLEELVKSLNLSKNIFFRGYKNHKKMPGFYQKADIFVSMTRAESFGQMYLEAMSSGLAIISCKNYASNELVKHGKTGMLININDYHKCAEHIEYLYKNPAILASMQVNSVEEAKKYDWEESILPQYEALYNMLIHEKKGS